MVEMKKPVERTFIGWLLVISLAPAALVIVGMAIRDPSALSAWRWLLCLTWYCLGLSWAYRRLSRRHRAHWLLPLIAAHLLILTPEVGLRAAGFRYESGVQFGDPKPSGFTYFSIHPTLFWTLSPEREGVNAWGLLGPDIVPEAGSAPEVEPSRRRVVALGDSVTYQGYPALLETLLRQGAHVGPTSAPFEVLNFGVPGYSSHQGRVLTDLYAQAVDAEVAVVAFGWNDHWLARGAEDHRKPSLQAPSRGASVYRGLERRSRILQAIRALAVGGSGSSAAGTPIDANRVPPAQFRANLEQIVARFRTAGTRPLLVTLPSLHTVTGAPAYLVETGLARTTDDVVKQHQEYNAIVRQVAAAAGIDCVDLEVRALAQSEGDALFMADGIHLTERGRLWMALEIADAVRQALSTPDRPES